ncbi:MAG TPA: hypothetical protein VJZ71_04750 [Phycisphaerae bacterium]|nr:hypothetical protein [Phycisphaerae bacterium]
MAGEENVFQLTFIDLAIQVAGIFSNVIVALFQSVLTQVFSGLLGAVTGGTV